MTRRATIERSTNETTVRVAVELDADPASAPASTPASDVRTGIGFLDHMLDAFARHAKLNLTVTCTGDLDVDDHHTAEDVALSIGQAIDEALGDRVGITRFASAHAPLDEALARVVVDLSGRPGAWVDLGLTREMLGTIACENLTHFFQSLAIGLRSTIHVDVLKGDNDHHRVEAAFKAFALALREAVARDGSDRVPSTKGVL